MLLGVREEDAQFWSGVYDVRKQALLEEKDSQKIL